MLKLIHIIHFYDYFLIIYLSLIIKQIINHSNLLEPIIFNKFIYEFFIRRSTFLKVSKNP